MRWCTPWTRGSAVCGAKRIAQHANPGLHSSPVRLSGENGCLYFVLGVVRIFSKFGAGCIFFQYLVTNYIFYGPSKGWLYFLVIFFEFLVFCHAFRANSVVFFHVPANQTNSSANRHAPATRTISGDSDGDDGASSGFILALRRIRIRSGGVLLSSMVPPPILP